MKDREIERVTGAAMAQVDMITGPGDFIIHSLYLYHLNVLDEGCTPYYYFVSYRSSC